MQFYFQEWVNGWIAFAECDFIVRYGAIFAFLSHEFESFMSA